MFAPNKTLAAQLYSEFREFFPKNAVEYFVSYYDYYQPEAYVPQRDLFIEKDSVDQRAHRADAAVGDQERAGAARRGHRRDGERRSTASAHPRTTHEMRDDHCASATSSASATSIAQLIRMQYTRNETDFSRGTFRVRGDTIDVFPAEHSELAIRIELFDDEIESLQLFDPLTGRIRQKIPRFTVYPSSHYVTPRETRASTRSRRSRTSCASGSTSSSRHGKLVEAQRLEQRTRFDLEMLQEIGHCKGIENYTRHLSGAAPGEPPPTLVDYLPQGRADVPRREPRA